MLAALLDLSVDAIITVDEHEIIVQYNRGAEAIFGWSAVEAIGTSIALLIPERLHGAHSEHMKRFAQSPDGARLMGARRPIVGRRKHGEEFRAEASISSASIEGRTYFGIVLRDISERERDALAQRYLTEATTLQLGSPFDFRRQVELHLFHSMPDPTGASRDFEESLKLEHYTTDWRGMFLQLKEFNNLSDNACLCRWKDPRVHRQGDNLVGYLFRHGKVTWAQIQVSISFLKVQRNRIVDARRDSRSIEIGS